MNKIRRGVENSQLFETWYKKTNLQKRFEGEKWYFLAGEKSEETNFVRFEFSIRLFFFTLWETFGNSLLLQIKFFGTKCRIQFLCCFITGTSKYNRDQFWLKCVVRKEDFGMVFGSPMLIFFSCFQLLIVKKAFIFQNHYFLYNYLTSELLVP